MIDPKAVFQEFMELSYSKPGNYNIGFRDIYLCDYTIARLTQTGCNILYLANGTDIKIDWRWLDLFSSLNTYSGHKILRNKITDENDNIDKTIYYFLRFQIALDNKNGTDLLNTLADISHIRTIDFREWYKNEYGEKLSPLEYTSLDKYIEI